MHDRRGYRIEQDQDGSWTVIYMHEQDIAVAFTSYEDAQSWFSAHLAILTQDFDNSVVH